MHKVHLLASSQKQVHLARLLHVTPHYQVAVSDIDEYLLELVRTGLLMDIYEANKSRPQNGFLQVWNGGTDEWVERIEHHHSDLNQEETHEIIAKENKGKTSERGNDQASSGFTPQDYDGSAKLGKTICEKPNYVTTTSRETVKRMITLTSLLDVLTPSHKWYDDEERNKEFSNYLCSEFGFDNIESNRLEGLTMAETIEGPKGSTVIAHLDTLNCRSQSYDAVICANSYYTNEKGEEVRQAHIGYGRACCRHYMMRNQRVRIVADDLVNFISSVEEDRKDMGVHLFPRDDQDFDVNLPNLNKNVFYSSCVSCILDLHEKYTLSHNQAVELLYSVAFFHSQYNYYETCQDWLLNGLPKSNLSLCEEMTLASVQKYGGVSSGMAAKTRRHQSSFNKPVFRSRIHRSLSKLKKTLVAANDDKSKLTTKKIIKMLKNDLCGVGELTAQHILQVAILTNLIHNKKGNGEAAMSEGTKLKKRLNGICGEWDVSSTVSDGFINDLTRAVNKILPSPVAVSYVENSLCEWLRTDGSAKEIIFSAQKLYRIVDDGDGPTVESIDRNGNVANVSSVECSDDLLTFGYEWQNRNWDGPIPDTFTDTRYIVKQGQAGKVDEEEDAQTNKPRRTKRARRATRLVRLIERVKNPSRFAAKPLPTMDEINDLDDASYGRDMKRRKLNTTTNQKRLQQRRKTKSKEKVRLRQRKLFASNEGIWWKNASSTGRNDDYDLWEQNKNRHVDGSDFPSVTMMRLFSVLKEYPERTVDWYKMARIATGCSEKELCKQNIILEKHHHYMDSKKATTLHIARYKLVDQVEEAGYDFCFPVGQYECTKLMNKTWYRNSRAATEALLLHLVCKYKPSLLWDLLEKTEDGNRQARRSKKKKSSKLAISVPGGTTTGVTSTVPSSSPSTGAEHLSGNPNVATSSGPSTGAEHLSGNPSVANSSGPSIGDECLSSSPSAATSSGPSSKAKKHKARRPKKKAPSVADAGVGADANHTSAPPAFPAAESYDVSSTASFEPRKQHGGVVLARPHISGKMKEDTDYPFYAAIIRKKNSLFLVNTSLNDYFKTALKLHDLDEEPYQDDNVSQDEMIDEDDNESNGIVQAVPTGTTLLRKFGSHYHAGTIASFDKDLGCYLVHYDDGDEEELDLKDLADSGAVKLLSKEGE